MKMNPQKKFEMNNIRRFTFKFHKTHDLDIINQLETQKNKQGYIKQLIREDIQKLSK